MQTQNRKSEYHALKEYRDHMATHEDDSGFIKSLRLSLYNSLMAGHDVLLQFAKPIQLSRIQSIPAINCRGGFLHEVSTYKDSGEEISLKAILEDENKIVVEHQHQPQQQRILIKTVDKGVIEKFLIQAVNYLRMDLESIREIITKEEEAKLKEMELFIDVSSYVEKLDSKRFGAQQ
ncbi:hypothetical protein [Microbulbifer sp. MCCC 1A16149]|uniref:hypothetical protein n=1 Tax=Microbulbifer sp. MCCC 1A16149 TaxID=3411322 RepID=UPI003D135023